METFVWDSNFITDIVSVDQQHRGLLAVFNELSESLDGRSDLNEAQAYQVYRKLVEYAQHHFLEEEKLMAEVGLDVRYRMQHHEAHEAFVEQLQSLWSTKETLSHPAEVFLSFLTSWLALHVLGIDQAMARQIRRVFAGESAEEAYMLENHPKDHSVEAMVKAMGNIYKVLSRLNVELSASNRQLEHSVSERTQTLERVNAELVSANRKLEVSSHTDGLLAIANRAYFDEQLEREWQRAMRMEQPLGLLMIDVDFFKPYNDGYGHQAGDACLKAVANAAGACIFRATDLLARYGGEELVLVLPNTDVNGAVQVGRDICEAVVQLGIAHTGSHCAPCVTVSVGAAAMVPSRDSVSAQLITVADQALYRAKDQGRNRVCQG